MKSKVFCKYPILIYNPSLLTYVKRGFRKIIYGDRFTYDITLSDVIRMEDVGYLDLKFLSVLKGYRLRYEFSSLPIFDYPVYISVARYKSLSLEDKHKYFPKYDIDVFDLDKYLLVDSSTGESVNIYQLVTCNHCVLCNHRKRNKFKYRTLIESSKHTNSPFFITLTYDDVHYPLDDKDTSSFVRELQLFNKRLRKYLSYHDTPTSYKYCFVSEYGTAHSRLHFHGLIFGLPNRYYVPSESAKMESESVFLLSEKNSSLSSFAFQFQDRYLRPCTKTNRNDISKSDIDKQSLSVGLVQTVVLGIKKI